MAPSYTKTNHRGLHPNAQCCGGQKQALHAHPTPSFIVFSQTMMDSHSCDFTF